MQSLSSQQHDRTIESDLRLALGQPGCPVCRVLREKERRLLCDTSPPAGTCLEHLAQLIECCDVLAGATVALGALERVTGDMTTAAPCQVCGELDEEAAQALVVLGQGVTRGDLADRFARSDGLCLLHLRMAVARGVPGVEALLRDRQTRIERLRGQLRALLASFEPARGRARARTWLEAEHALRRAPAQLALPSGRRP